MPGQLVKTLLQNCEVYIEHGGFHFQQFLETQYIIKTITVIVMYTLPTR